MKVLLITYEFTHAPFSGNGMLSRSLAKSLLSLGASLRVICCRPAPTLAGLAGDNHLAEPEVARPDIELWTIQLQEAAGWKRLDDASAYKDFWAGAGGMGAAVARFAPEAVVAVDWTGAGAWRALRESGVADSKLCYLNFRVYASGMAESRGGWFDSMEAAALEQAQLVLALSPADQKSLAALQRRSSPLTATLPPVRVLMPPLRADVAALALASGSGAAAAAASAALPPALAAALALPGARRRFVTCGVRLSSEKEPMRFVAFVEHASAALRALGLTPLLFGAAAEARRPHLRRCPGTGHRHVHGHVPRRTHCLHGGRVGRVRRGGKDEAARRVRGCRRPLRRSSALSPSHGLIDRLIGRRRPLRLHRPSCPRRRVCGHRTQLSPVQIRRLWRGAYGPAPPLAGVASHPLDRGVGMSVVEAAAFGAPSVVNGGAKVGAAQLLPADEGASFEARFDGAADEAVSAEVLALLGDQARGGARRDSRPACGKSAVDVRSTRRASLRSGARHASGRWAGTRRLTERRCTATSCSSPRERPPTRATAGRRPPRHRAGRALLRRGKAERGEGGGRGPPPTRGGGRRRSSTAIACAGEVKVAPQECA